MKWNFKDLIISDELKAIGYAALMTFYLLIIICGTILLIICK
jgi:hypothetical protein